MSFAFVPGEDYIITFRRSDGVNAFSSKFDFMVFGNGSEESNLGILSIKDGRAGMSGAASWTTHYRMSVVPEPNTAVLFATGLIGLTLYRQRGKGTSR